MTLRTLNYGNYGTFLIIGNAGFCPSTVSPPDPPSKTPGFLAFKPGSEPPYLELHGYVISGGSFKGPFKGIYRDSTRV